MYHGFGLIGYTYVRSAYEEGKVIFTVKHRKEKLHCPACGSRDLILKGCSPRRFRMVPIGSKVLFLDLDIQRVACRRCDAIRQVELGFADSRFSYTRAFERYVLELSRHMTILDIVPASPRVVGRHQGHPEEVPEEKVFPAYAQGRAVPGYR